MTVQDVSQADVRVAEREAAADVAKIEALKQRVMAGEDVTPDELGKAKQLAEWSELRVTAVRQQAEATTERKRQEALALLRPDIDQFADRFAADAAAKLQAVTDAVVDYWRYMDAENATLAELHARAVALTDREWMAPIVPPEHDAGIGRRAHLLIAGRRRIDRLDAGKFLGRALTLAARELNPAAVRFHLDHHGTVTVSPADRDADPVADLARVTAEMPEPGAAHFYRGPAGLVIERDQPYDEAEIKRLNLKTITAKEAWGV